VQRGAEGTTPQSHPQGALVQNRWTAGTYEDLWDGVDNLRDDYEQHKADFAAHLADGASHSKTARFVVGTSTAGWTLEHCDYLCDGTNDQVEINNAITALPASGGEVVILDGTYNITAPISVNKNNVSVRGNGNATVLKRMWNSSSGEGVITLTSVQGCRIENLQIDGNKATYTASYNYGIRLYSSSDNTVTGNTCNNNNSHGIYLYSSSDNTVTGNTCNNNSHGIYLSSSSNNTVTGNTCNNNSRGIYLSSSSNNTVTGNTCNNNSYYGIYLSSSSNNTVTGNTYNNNNSHGIYLYSSSDNTVTGNTCNNNSYYGIYLSSSSNNTVTGNTCNNNNEGITLVGSNNNTITGNTCIRGTGQPSDYTSDQYTIHLSGSGNRYNLISSNNCMGKDVVIEGGTSNTSVNNKYN
jgi:parallel beta-helix repeat protein